MRGRGIVHLHGHIQYDEIATAFRQQGYLAPVSDHQHNIAKLQRLVDDRPIHGFTVALQADNIEPKAGAKTDLADRFTDQFRIRNQRDFGHPHIQRLI